MLKKILIGLLLLVLVVGGFMAYLFATTKNHSPLDVAQFSKNGFEMSVTYCQPYKKGRLIFGDVNEEALVPFGHHWRTGANEATEVTFNKDIAVGGKELAAGTYSLYTIPGKEEWTIAFNEALGEWGITLGGESPFDDPDILQAQVKPSLKSEELEQLTIDFQEVNEMPTLRIRWDKTEVLVPIEVKA